jgi:hypothetical protein
MAPQQFPEAIAAVAPADAEPSEARERYPCKCLFNGRTDSQDNCEWAMKGKHLSDRRGDALTRSLAIDYWQFAIGNSSV